MVKEVTYFKTSDGSLHRTRKIAEEHEKYLKSPLEKAREKADLMKRVKKRWPDLKTGAQSYDEGYRSGKEWPKEWTHRPGGPFVHTSGHSNDEEWIEYCKQSRINANAWLMGWQDGICINFGAPVHLKEYRR